MKRSLVLCVLLLLLFAGCRIYDGPPRDPDTPAPSPHVGAFVSAHGSLTFSGDGKSVELDLDEELAALLGLPEGKSRGTYEFRAQTPPHEYEERYDRANIFCLYVDEYTCRLHNSMGGTNENTLKLFAANSEGKTVELLFMKSPEGKEG